ncbi:CDP-alcohol phosphatidyltransferase family protein [Aeromicrobium sp. Leaf350]|uniref:CDP-alcohol phosphatidyltransferase family protein n=1 Tax=Aeromicrobium sp. Leaf350 TaxID=2876565 RepID=UPI001E2ADE01|nr:CDP-alcohol phosphatidyltransferase family protein [Aeromicrobium sp. Leaf350]
MPEPTSGPDSTTPPSNLNIANALTVLRIAGVPLYGWLLLVDGGSDIETRVWSFVAFSLLMITDRIDGDLARSRGLVTDFGKLADPIADKALTGMAFIGLAIIFDHWLFWVVAILTLIREWGITVMRLFIAKYGVMPASQGGRIKTTVQAGALALYSLPLELWDTTASDVTTWVAHVFLAVAFVITMVTGVQYVIDARKLRADWLASQDA